MVATRDSAWVSPGIYVATLLKPIDLDCKTPTTIQAQFLVVSLALLDGKVYPQEQKVEGGCKMDWETLYCPNKSCQNYGIPFRKGKLVKNGTNHGQPQALYKSCGTSVPLS